jgi:hypothetical protein
MCHHYQEEIQYSLDEKEILKKHILDHNSTVNALYGKQRSLYKDCNFDLACLDQEMTNLDLVIGRQVAYMGGNEERIRSVEDDLDQALLMRDLARTGLVILPALCWAAYFFLARTLPGRTPPRTGRPGKGG